MSDTPRTDAALVTVDVAFTSHDGLASEPKEVIEPDFAKQLERENAALREDKERLADTAEEVLERLIDILRILNFPRPQELAICRQLRDAIDAARTKEAKP